MSHNLTPKNIINPIYRTHHMGSGWTSVKTNTAIAPIVQPNDPIHIAVSDYKNDLDLTLVAVNRKLRFLVESNYHLWIVVTASSENEAEKMRDKLGELWTNVVVRVK